MQGRPCQRVSATGKPKPGVEEDEPARVTEAVAELSGRAVEQPVHVHDFQATMLHLLGIDHERLTYRFQGRRYRLTDVHGEVVRGVLA